MLEDAYKDAESLITRMDEFKLNARVDQEVLAQITANFDILIHVPRIPPPLNYLARINESEGGGMNRFMSVYNTFVGV